MFYFDFNKSSWGIEAKSKSSKLDYSKRSIRKYLKDSFDLKGTELNSKVNDLYIRLSTINREVMNREVTLKDFESQLNEIAIIDNKLVSKGYSNDFKLTRSGKVTKQINFIIWLHNGYKTSNVNLNDLKQDLILYYLDNQKTLLLHYKQAVKRFKVKYEVNYRFSYSTFIFKVLKKEFRKKVNSYLYTVNIPFEIEKKFVKKAFTKQKKTQAINRILIDIDGQFRDILPDLPSIKDCYIRKPAAVETIGSQLYFDLANKYDNNSKNDIDIELFINKEKLAFKGFDGQVYNLKCQGFQQKEIACQLDCTIDKIKKASQRINKAFK